LSLDDLDETIFLNEKNSTTSPSKFTPFTKQGINNPFKKHFEATYNYKKENVDSKQKGNTKMMNCQRILNYEPKTEIETPIVTNNISQFVSFV
jgi:hypothetical protein